MQDLEKNDQLLTTHSFINSKKVHIFEERRRRWLTVRYRRTFSFRSAQSGSSHDLQSYQVVFWHNIKLIRVSVLDTR